MREHNIDHLIQESLHADSELERRFAHSMQALLKMREAIHLESCIEEDPIAVALLESGVTALDASIGILRHTWQDRENQ